MEVLAIIVAFWLILVGVYGALSLIAANYRRREQRRMVGLPDPRATGAGKNPPMPRPAIASEVDLLRVQVETLRSEVVALSGSSGLGERPRLRRYRTGQYTDLPRLLRRHVRHVRNTRHPLGV